ncbi:MAG: hypothetical protein O3A82_02810 [Verrucomicrobia bacterium]|nr:hypothetical protein [Verrucomicrobiota bacterium]MDA1045840.1 hypothetical protein [Verrucomicrobiota bacterium]
MNTRPIFISLKCSVLIAGIALSTLFCGCLKQFIPHDDVPRSGTDRKFPDLNYTGDGNFTDYGRKSGIQRFVLDLGEVDLKEASVRKYELKGLPDVNYVCYLRVDHPLPITGRPKDFKAGDMIVETSLEDQNGTEVFSEKAPLKNWKWSGSVGSLKSDLYTRKTMFTPEKGQNYSISLKISEGNLQAPKVQLLLMGGGWKAFN